MHSRELAGLFLIFADSQLERQSKIFATSPLFLAKLPNVVRSQPQLDVFRKSHSEKNFRSCMSLFRPFFRIREELRVAKLDLKSAASDCFNRLGKVVAFGFDRLSVEASPGLVSFVLWSTAKDGCDIIEKERSQNRTLTFP